MLCFRLKVGIDHRYFLDFTKGTLHREQGMFSTFQQTKKITLLLLTNNFAKCLTYIVKVCLCAFAFVDM